MKHTIRQSNDLEYCTPEEVLTAMSRYFAVQIWDCSLSLGKTSGIEEQAITAVILPLLTSLGLKASKSTLFSWRRAFRDAGVGGLVDLRGRSDRAAYRKFYTELAQLYSSELMSGRLAHELTLIKAMREGWAIPTVRESMQYLKEHVRPGLTTERGGKAEGRSNGASTDI